MSPSILQFILTQVGGEDLWDVFDLFQRNVLKPKPSPERAGSSEFETKVPEKTVTSRSPRERQKWFVDQLAEGRSVSAENLMDHWNINLRTARRDISGLIGSRRIVFHGRRKTGRYELMPITDTSSASLPTTEDSISELPRRRGRPRKMVAS